MTMFRRFALTGIALCLISTGAMAADIADQAPDRNWSGLYLGLHAGWGWSDIDYGIDRNSDFWEDPQFKKYSVDADGLIAGLQGGFNWQIDNFLLGAEADISWADIDGDFGKNNLPGTGYFYDDDSSIDWLASVRARAGLIWDEVLFYATGGVAFTSVDTDAKSDWSGAVRKYSDTTSHTGWVLGGGIEYMITDNITGRVEYLHYEFDDQGFSDEHDGYNLKGDVDLDLDVVRAGINFKFD